MGGVSTEKGGVVYGDGGEGDPVESTCIGKTSAKKLTVLREEDTHSVPVQVQQDKRHSE